MKGLSRLLQRRNSHLIRQKKHRSNRSEIVSAELTKKARFRWETGLEVWRGGDLLSRANAHYHRRKPVSRSCSGWEGVGPARCCHQAVRARRACCPVGAHRSAMLGEEVVCAPRGCPPAGLRLRCSSVVPRLAARYVAGHPQPPCLGL